jgi:hypothetical protein
MVETIEGTKAKRLACMVVIQAMEDAFLLKKNVKNHYRGQPSKNRINLILKSDAVNWLKGENDVEGFKIIVGMTDIDPAVLVKKARDWFVGEHAEGYEFKDAKELKDALGVDLGGLERDLRGAYGDYDDRRQSSGGTSKKLCNKIHKEATR